MRHRVPTFEETQVLVGDKPAAGSTVNLNDYPDYMRIQQAVRDAAGDNGERCNEVDEEDELHVANTVGRTEAANGRRLVRQFGERIRYCAPWSKDLVWDGRRWGIDQSLTVQQFAKDVFDSLWVEAEEAAYRVEPEQMRTVWGFIKASGTHKGLQAMVALARSEPGIPVLPNALDTHPMLLNVANGTLDLEKVTLRKHSPSDYLTKLAPVVFDPQATCPLWEKFHSEIFAGDQELIEFSQRMLGYSLSGDVREDAFPVLYGTGGNGKSVYMQTYMALLGSDYAMKAPKALLSPKRGDSHPTELADLHGMRFVAAIETEEGGRLAEGLVKELTGGDDVRARRMREDFWQFAPTHKLWLATNHKPQVRGTDEGIWRRLRLIPFAVRFDTRPDCDRQLDQKLLGELPGLLNWCLAGLRDWLRDGLPAPAAVRAATAQYRTESDTLGTFLDEVCLFGEGMRCKASLLFASYKRWHDEGNHPKHGMMTMTAFGLALGERGYGKEKKRDGWWYLGLGLVAGHTTV